MRFSLKYERVMVANLGDEIGFGRMMQLAQSVWRDRVNGKGSEFAYGPCVSMTVPCPHPEKDANGHCEWCCGSGWVTKRVLEAMPKP